MRLDTQTTFCEAQALTGASADSTNTIDIGKARITENQGFVVVHVTTKLTAATKVALMNSAESAANYVTVGAVEFAADTEAGTYKVIPIPPGCKQYLKLQATGTSMGGAISGYMTLSVPSVEGIEHFEAN